MWGRILTLLLLAGCGSDPWRNPNAIAHADEGSICIEDNQDLRTKRGWSPERLREWCEQSQ